MKKSTTEYIKWKLLDQVEVVGDCGSYELLLEPERDDELDLMESPAFN